MFSNKKTHFVNIKRKRMGMWYQLFIAQLLFYHRGKSTYDGILNIKVKPEVINIISINIQYQFVNLSQGVKMKRNYITTLF